MLELIEQYGLLAASGMVGVAAAFAAWTVVVIVSGPRPSLAPSEGFEEQRLEQVRAGSFVFRSFEPLVAELARFYDPDGARLRQLGRHLRLANEGLPWRPAEFLATKLIEAMLSSIAVYLLIAPTGFGLLAAILAGLLLFSYPWLAEQSVVSRSNRHLKRIRLRMPFAVDQIALMLQAGADFEGSLQTVVRDNVRHPLGTELAEVLRQINLGRSRSQALNDLRGRCDDKDISELVFAINKGEELGTPMSSILREQADQMRLKRSQWGEKAASEAEVQMVFPGMIVMVACLLVIVAPILLPALLTFLE